MSIKDTFKGVVFKTYLENAYNEEFVKLRKARKIRARLRRRDCAVY